MFSTKTSDESDPGGGEKPAFEGDDAYLSDPLLRAIESALRQQSTAERRKAAETPDYSPGTKARAYAILAVSKAVKAGAIPETATYEVLKYYHEHGQLPESVAPFAVPVPPLTDFE